MLGKAYTATLKGVNGSLTEVETHITKGLPHFAIIGLTDTVIKEAIERIRSATSNTDNPLPQCKIIVNLSPARERKNGSHYDLAMAISILAAAEKINNFSKEEYAFFGELALDGKINSVPGILPLVLCVEKANIKKVFVPYENRIEASLVKNCQIIPVKNLGEVIDILNGDIKAEVYVYNEENKSEYLEHLDFAEVFGQENAKRALTIAAAGGHNILLKGVPGVGKTMLAKRFAGLMPELTYEETMEIAKVYSVMGLLDKDVTLIKKRPFRSPHNSITHTALLGGGGVPKPGEVSLAHKGVLFLDELSNFDRKNLELLRQPIEEGEIVIDRVRDRVVFPAEFLLVAASNPCYCGYAGSSRRVCSCTPRQIATFESKLSGPLLDRIDIHVTMEDVDFETLESYKKGGNDQIEGNKFTTEKMKIQVQKARMAQEKRYKDEKFSLNCKISGSKIEKYCLLNEDCMELMKMAYNKLQLSMRGYEKILKVARTIADMDESLEIKSEHLMEALQYREKRNN